MMKVGIEGVDWASPIFCDGGNHSDTHCWQIIIGYQNLFLDVVVALRRIREEELLILLHRSLESNVE